MTFFRSCLMKASHINNLTYKYIHLLTLDCLNKASLWSVTLLIFLKYFYVNKH